MFFESVIVGCWQSSITSLKWLTFMKQNKTLQATFVEETSCFNLSETVDDTFLVSPLIYDETVTIQNTLHFLL